MSEWNSFLSCSRDWAVVAQLRIPEKPLIKQQLWPTYVPLKSDLELQPANSENIKWRLSSTLSECLIANLISPDLTDLWAWAPQNLQTPTIRWLNFKFSLECSNLLIPSGNSSLETFKLSPFSHSREEPRQRWQCGISLANDKMKHHDSIYVVIRRFSPPPCWGMPAK